MGRNGLAGHLSTFRDSSQAFTNYYDRLGENPDNALFYTLKDIRVNSVLITRGGEGSPQGDKAINIAQDNNS